MEGVKPWVRKQREQIADCRVFSVHESTSVSPSTDEEHSFYVLESADWVNVVPVTAQNEIVCIRQFRHGTEQVTLEIPGGLVDPGESPVDAAAREMREESGFAAAELVSLGVLSPNPALFPNRLHTFVAADAKQVDEVRNTSTEHTEVQLIPMAQLSELLVSGEIDHALVAATLWRLLYLLKG
ncbi:MAG: NUDIX hydrolase [Proteobacteria bacterium]|nr:NUDIX hydrolase [Pseudomonadota bacterium]MDA1299792.1 NUDIX hydrolase [Pseudomonadota bacterium]